MLGAEKALFSVSIAFVFLLLNMASLSFEFKWHFVGSFKTQLLILISIAFALYFLLLFKSKLAYTLISIFFFTNIVYFSVSNPDSSQQQEVSTAWDSNDLEVAKSLKDIKLNKKPDIYILIYDSYPNVETMQMYGIDNSTQYGYLEKQGFHTYHSTWSLDDHSFGTMGRVLGLTGSSGENRVGTAGNVPLIDYLDINGYLTAGIFSNDYFFRGQSKVNYDFYIPKKLTNKNNMTVKHFKNAILEGEFRFNAGFDIYDHDEFVRSKRTFFDKGFTSQPKFIYTHTGPGHSQMSGVCRDNETELFVERLNKANLEMQKDIEKILAADREAIIIVAGDHGPWLTKTCTYIPNVQKEAVNRFDVQDRVGTFLAVKWPYPEKKTPENIEILQDIMPAVLEYISDQPNDLRMPQDSTPARKSAGVIVENGIIRGGVNDGEPLFLYDENGNPPADAKPIIYKYFAE